MSVKGAGDRWLAGENVDGVTFARHDVVRFTSGSRAGATGVIELLVALAPEPQYLIVMHDGGNVRAPQSVLEPCEQGR